MRLIFSETYDQSSSFANSSRIFSSLISTTFLLDVSIFQSRKSLYSLTNERSICWFLESALQFISAPFSHACLRESIDGIKDGLLDKLYQLKFPLNQPQRFIFRIRLTSSLLYQVRTSLLQTSIFI